MKVDILIKNGFIVTLEDQDYPDGYLAILGDSIHSIGPMDQMPQFDATTILDAKGKIVAPGLVNTHTHSGNTLLRGFADDFTLMKWLQEYIFPAEKEFCKPENVRLATELMMLELLQSGTTSFSDMYYFMNDVAEVTYAVGMRCQVGETFLDFPSPTSKSPNETISRVRETYSNWKDNDLIKVAVAPHAPYTCGTDTLKNAKALSEELGINFHIHLSETLTEVENCLKEHGKTPTEYLDSIGCLDGDVFAIHCVHLTDNDKDILLRKNVDVSHNPQSNMKLASGICQVDDLLKKGINVAIGTDGAASNNNLNMFEEMDYAAKLQKVATMDPTVLDAKTVFRMATINGAKLMRTDHLTGSLAEGKKADILITGLDKARTKPFFDPYSHLVYAMNGSEVVTTIVNGRVLYHDGAFKTLDEERILKETAELGVNIAKLKD